MKRPVTKKKATKAPAVKRGSTWKDKDARGGVRVIEVVRIDRKGFSPRALCRTRETGRETWIKLDMIPKRFDLLIEGGA